MDDADRKNQQDLSYEQYLATRAAYDKAELEVSGRYDNWILTLSAGALAISLTFLEKIAPHPRPPTITLLIFAWCSLLAALLSALISLLTSQSAIRERRDDLDRTNEQNLPSQEARRRRFFVRWTNGLNWFSCIVFVVGVFLLGWFSIANLPQNSKENQNVRQEHSTSSEEDHH